MTLSRSGWSSNLGSCNIMAHSAYNRMDKVEGHLCQIHQVLSHGCYTFLGPFHCLILIRPRLYVCCSPAYLSSSRGSYGLKLFSPTIRGQSGAIRVFQGDEKFVPYNCCQIVTCILAPRWFVIHKSIP